jgi:hypothetical protein
VKQCSRCGREIAESATVCDDCRQQVVESVAPLFLSEDATPAGRPDPAPAEARASAAEPASVQAARPSGMPRQLVFLILAVAGAGVLTLGIVMTRGSASPAPVTAAGSPPDTPAPAAPPKTAVPMKGRWSAENSAYWVGRQRKAIAFELLAENKIGVWMRQVHPRLVVRCMASRTEVFVLTESAAKIELGTEDHTVRIGFDDQPEVAERWPDSSEHDALFAPDGAAFAQRLTTASTLRFGFTPHNAAPASMRFNVGGLGPLIEPVARECGWKK